MTTWVLPAHGSAVTADVTAWLLSQAGTWLVTSPTVPPWMREYGFRCQASEWGFSEATKKIGLTGVWKRGKNTHMDSLPTSFGSSVCPLLVFKIKGLVTECQDT